MNQQDFIQRATVNPYDESKEFQDALSSKAEHQQLVDEMQHFDRQLEQVICESVTPPADLRQRLLDIAGHADETATVQTHTTVNVFSWHWTRVIGLAACLVVAIALAYTTTNTDRIPVDKELEQEIFSHIYREINYLNSSEHIPVQLVNSKMTSTVGSGFLQSTDMSQVDFKVADDCWIAKQVSMHLVLQGDRGAVTVLVIPNEPVHGEMNISDERFDGLILPTPSGNLVVVGEKLEPVSEVSNLIARNIAW